jgi:hypothetical protein
VTTKNRAQLLADVATLFPTNGAEEITASILRGQQTDVIESFINLLTETPSLYYINSAQDFIDHAAAYAGGTITLQMARYHVQSAVDLGTDDILLAGGSIITGDTASISSITTNSANPTITAAAGGFQACGLIGHAGLTINNTGSGAAVRVQDTDTICFGQNLLTTAAGTGLEIHSPGGFGLNAWTFTSGVTDGCVITWDSVNPVPRTIMQLFNAAGVTGKGIDIQAEMDGPLLLEVPIIDSVGDGITCSGDIQGIGVTDGSITSTGANGMTFSGSAVGSVRFSGARLASSGGDALDISSASTISTLIFEAANLQASGGGNACFRTAADSADNIGLGADFATTSFIAIAGATALVNASKKDIALSFSGCIGSSSAVDTEIADSNPIGCYTLTGSATTKINTVNVWERVGGTTATCPTLERFSQIANNTLQYDGLNNFSGVPHATFTVDKSGASKDFEFAFGVDTGAGVVIDTSSIMTSEIKTTLVPISLVSSVDFATGTDIGVFVRNIDDDNDIIFESMNVVIK